MADETKQETAEPKAAKPPKPPRDQKGGKGGGKGKDVEAAAEPKGPPPVYEPAPPARLAITYAERARPALARRFGFTNPHQIPRVVKVVLNVGLGEAHKAPKALEAIVAEMGQITGQKALVTRAKKAISNFSIRAGMPIGASVTLRGARMWEFLDRFINIAVPRIRDFRGLPTRSFDGRGNYTFGIKEQMIFPEIDFDKVERIHGMDITIVTTAGRDDVAMALLRELGVPFHGEQPVDVS
ncbi:MAG TPA: 50S ribosomal protein L5 [Gemmatimonadales bacterium]|nr:50S ribosomal protein L5 [Gemmatimonadales bacterium]